MIQRFALAAALLLAVPLHAQERATTANGRAVLLYPDGKWKYAPALVESDKHKGADAVERNRPASATEKLDLAKGKLALYYDPGKWKPVPRNEPGRLSLLHNEGDGYSLILAERLEVSLDALRNIALQNALNAAPDARITSERRLKVNGVEVMELQIRGTIQSIPFVYLGYYYSGKEGSIQLLTYTASNLFDEYRDDFQELLDGFVVASGN